MGKTIRKDRYDKKVIEGLKKRDSPYRCRCSYCTGVDRNEIIRQINKDILEEELDEYYN